MARRVESTGEEPKAEAECQHHWIIERPKGPTSRGVCKYCGAEKEFLNYWSSFFWEDDISMLDDVFDTQSATSHPGEG